MPNKNKEAEKAVETVAAEPKKTVATKTAKASAESIYPVEELIANFKAFGTSREIVAVALRDTGKKDLTFAAAKAIVDIFRKREVK